MVKCRVELVRPLWMLVFGSVTPNLSNAIVVTLVGLEGVLIVCT